MKLITTIIFISFSLFAFNQGNNGYFRKKNLVSFNALGSVPVLYWVFSKKSYQKVGDGLEAKKDYIDYGFNLSLSHAFSGKIALGFDFGLYYANVEAPQSGRLMTENASDEIVYYFKHEQLQIQTMSFIPKIEFSLESPQLPYGMSNQVGIGFTSTKVLDKDYRVILNTQESGPIESFNPKNLVDPKMKTLYGLTIMYSFNVKNPISKRLLINYGIRYTYNASFQGVHLNDHTEYYVSYERFREEISLKRITNALTLNIGLSYTF